MRWQGVCGKLGLTVVLVLTIGGPWLAAGRTTATLAAFNIQVFGETKASKPDVMADIVSICHNFDFVAIQEIRDASSEALATLMDALNENQPTALQYINITGPREGTTSSKEQYAFVYRPARIRVHDAFALNMSETFERPPMAAIVEVLTPGSSNRSSTPAALRGEAPLITPGGPSSPRYPVTSSLASSAGLFQVLVLHAKPSSDATYLELSALDQARQIATQYAGVEPTVLAGDFNAGCSYLPADKEAEVTIFKSPYTVLINDSADTTSTNSVCPYDRIVTFGNIGSRILQSGIINTEAAPFNFDQERAEAVSDHYPIAYEVAAATTTSDDNPAVDQPKIVHLAPQAKTDAPRRQTARMVPPLR
ncbi:uncharacterized protein MONBRDRAFT_37144 [Monosiga brevicollis MX1]|uniref:Endonuclease/exonuclease/phosphatase domain-containing protein n=1 Tax=Monosiga brevicollis TaxID=81824 RepID=A9UZW1_MONBE|nr:uncharacterized protein MONBRDRAFT_37144 [Monosiga brevicollis MX1]EDQ89303.1 predicted protein [Monosiga brevicollis MX1]|eukprot:XP_001745879.1 hypothetical protein [Monosiga brevicollis MX1]